MKTKFLRILLLLSLIIGAGCSTPVSRIKEKPAVFAALSPENQEAVKNGRVDIGFTQDMVYLALGHAHRTYSRTTSNGEVEVWSYVDTEIRNEQQMVTGNFHYRDREGRLRGASDSVWVNVQHHDEYEKIRLEFSGGKVSAIDRIRR